MQSPRGSGRGLRGDRVLHVTSPTLARKFAYFVGRSNGGAGWAHGRRVARAAGDRRRRREDLTSDHRGLGLGTQTRTYDSLDRLFTVTRLDQGHPAYTSGSSDLVAIRR